MSPDASVSFVLLPREQWTARYLADARALSAAVAEDHTYALSVLHEGATALAREQEEFQRRQTQQNHLDALQARIAFLESNATTSSSSSSVPFPAPHRSAKLQNPSFDGQPKNLRPFIASLNNKLHGNADHFSSELDKVRFAYQCLEETPADRIRSHFRHLYDPSLPPEITTVSAFLALINLNFKDPSARQKADNKLPILAQRGTPFHDFINNFEDVVSESTFADQGRSTWKALLIPRLSDDLSSVVIAADNPPDSYEEFVRWLRTKDAHIQARKATRPATTTPSVPVRRSNATTAAFVAPAAPDVLTVAQGGSRMDLDSQSKEKGPDGRLTQTAKDARRRLGRCLRCNETGHFANLCPLGSRSPALRSVSPSAGSRAEELKDNL